VTSLAAAPPSIAARLARALTAWSLALGVAVGVAIWFTAAHEVNELLDDALQASAELMVELLARPTAAASVPASAPAPPAVPPVERFAWQLLAADGSVVARSPRAPATPWRTPWTAGFAEAEGWRLFGVPLNPGGAAGGQFLYVAQTHEERREARADVALMATVAALLIGLLGYAGLRAQVHRELRPLGRLSDTLDRWQVDAPQGPDPNVLGAAERAELVGVHRALAGVSARLAARLAHERTFAAHAAHALRTPLGGIDAQLALVLRDCPSPWRERVLRAREAAARLHGVVAALLGLFRTGERITPVDVDVTLLLRRLPIAGLEVEAAPGLCVRADADLLAAALANLLDNAQRHGASRVHLQAWSSATERGLQVDDDGPGLDEARRQHLQAVLDGDGGDAGGGDDVGDPDPGAGPGVGSGSGSGSGSGLGLILADRVARAHGGRLSLLPSPAGFRVVLRWPAQPR
jgi:signal transduction histidine kinase